MFSLLLILNAAIAKTNFTVYKIISWNMQNGLKIDDVCRCLSRAITTTNKEKLLWKINWAQNSYI